ncbi:MAG: PTS sugar transporter subunit IIA [Pseudomonadota bacterium]
MNITTILDVERVVVNAAPTSKKKTLEFLGNILCSKFEHLTPQLVTNFLCSREKLSSTAIGNGVALPHSRLKNINQAVAALVVLKNPIDFDTLDNQPVDIFFGLLVPENACEDHLQILAAVARLFNEPQNALHIRSLKTSQQVFDFACQALNHTEPGLKGTG